jgi:phosphoglycolate phosphatase-like HAD superfamily hydrolase
VTPSRYAAFLFDIDGTLLRAGGAGRRAFSRAMEELTGPVVGPVADMKFDGMTDRMIVREALSLSGRPFDATLADAILARYLEHLPGQLDSPGFRVLPGAADTLAQLQARGATLGLCTGNLAHGARLKLRHAGLDGYFDWSPAWVHGFAEDGEARALLVAAAVARVSTALRRRVAPAEVLIIGDTPRDVLAAREVGCSVLCVATGNYDAAALLACHPDAVAESLLHHQARQLLGLDGP